MKKTAAVILAACLCMAASSCITIKVGQDSSASSSEESLTESKEQTVSQTVSSHTEESGQDKENSEISESELDKKNKSDLSVLLRKKNELKNNVYFIRNGFFEKRDENGKILYDSEGKPVMEERKTVHNTYYYCDALIRDINHDGSYEMIVKYFVPPSNLMEGTVDQIRKKHNSNEYLYVIAYDIYTVQNGEAVSGGCFDITGTVFEGQQF